MRLALELCRRLIHGVFVAAILLVLLRAGLEYPHPPKWDGLWVVTELRRLLDPVITEFGEWTGMKWRAGSGIKVPLLLAGALLVIDLFLNGRLRGLVQWLTPAPARPLPVSTGSAAPHPSGLPGGATIGPDTPTRVLPPADRTSAQVSPTGTAFLPDTPTAAVPGKTTRIGRYEIECELGRGAMGVVYKAQDPHIGRTVAIKTIRIFDLDHDALELFKKRFMIEARSAGRLNHPGIVTVHDFAVDASGHPCLVMEFIEGQNLDQQVRAERLPLAQAVSVVIDIARALDFAHGKGIVHRDIKPANIMVTNGGQAKLSDFGIAKISGTELTMTGQIIGTPAFMSPEQVTGGAVDARSDIFSLGSVLYWLVTGERPFSGDTVTNIAFKVVQTEPMPPAQLNPALPEGLDRIVLRCLAKKPDDRYSSAGALADDLEKLRAGLRA
jgi:tRNA A-37 threonylcarbamoyl transferase component Bud32